MRIINLLDLDSQDIEPLLIKMTRSDDRLESFKGARLLELVRHLQAKGPAPTACGHLLLGELWLTPYNVANRVLVKVWVDWFDFAPLKDGLPEAHYRLQIERGKSPVSSDARANTVSEAEHAIWEAFGWST